MNNENELTAALSTIEKCREITNCPAGVDMQDHLRQLTAENVGLKAALHPADIPSEWTDVFGDTAVIEHDAAGDNQGHSVCWSWVGNQEEVIKSVLRAVDNSVKTHATDRIYSWIKADGVEDFADRLQKHLDEGDFVGDEVAVIVGAIDCGKEFCEQLREGADK